MSFSTHSLWDWNLTRLCATKTKKARNRLNEENIGKAPDNPSMGDINDITASTNKEWHGTFPEILRNVPQRSSSWSRTSFNSANINYTLDTHYWLRKYKSNGNAHLSSEESATEPFSPHWRSDQINNLMPNGMHNSGSRIGEELIWKVKMR